MSSLMNFLRDWGLPNPRKRRIDPPEERLPKLRRIGNLFNIRNRFAAKPSRPEPEKDHFLEVKQKRSSYNGILEDFLMDQQDKHLHTFNLVNDENDENVPQIRSSAALPGTSGLQKVSNFYNDGNGTNLFSSHTSKPVPRLLPIASQSSFSNFTSTNNIRHRRSIPDLVTRNRAFGGMTSNDFPAKKSIMDYRNGIDSMMKYDTLLKSVIPELYASSSGQRGNISNSTFKNTTETRLSPTGVFRSNPGFMSTSPEFYSNRVSKTETSKQPTCTIEISEDEDSEISFRNGNTSTTTNKDEKSSFSSANNPNSSFLVKPVNSMLEKTQRKSCCKDTAIYEICRKYSESRKKNDQEIHDINRTINKLSLETAKEEKLQQKRIDYTVSNILPTIVLDDDDECMNEFPPLNQEQRQLVRFALHGGSRNDLLAQKFNLSITRQDLQTLSGLNWLNDEVINYYMELIKERSSEEEYLPNTHVMNTFFIPKLLQSGHAGVRRWTRRVDIFSYDLIMVPVHVGNVHWCMAVINIRDKWIRYYDSMGSPNPNVLDALRNYLQEESMDKKQRRFDMTNWLYESVRDCPRQNNGSDCGVFSCMFAEFISRDSDISFDQSRMEYFREKMVLEILTGKLLL